MKKWLFVFSLCFLFSSILQAAVSGETRAVLRDLENSMKKIETLQTWFLQKKQLSLFQKEIQLQGTIAMQKPERFAWRTQSPLRYSLVVEGEKVSQWNEDTDKVETISFSSAPVIKTVMEQMQTWFYGAYGSLTDAYEISLISRTPVTLKFVPNEKSPAYGMIRSVTIRFKTDLSYIESIEIEEKNGDRSLMEFSETVLNGKIAPEVWDVKHGS